METEMQLLRDALLKKRLAECDEAEIAITNETLPALVDELRVLRAQLQERLQFIAHSRELALQNLNHSYRCEVQQAQDEYAEEKRRLKEGGLEKLAQRKRDMLKDIDGDNLDHIPFENEVPYQRSHTPPTPNTEIGKRRRASEEESRSSSEDDSTDASAPAPTERRPTPSASSKGAPPVVDVHVIHGSLHLGDLVFEKGDPVIVITAEGEQRGTLSGINSSEVAVVSPGGTRRRIYHTHLRKGKCTLRHPVPLAAPTPPPPPRHPADHQSSNAAQPATSSTAAPTPSLATSSSAPMQIERPAQLQAAVR